MVAMEGYKTVVVDPPWRYSSSDILTKGQTRTASVESKKLNTAHYTTMTTAEIADLPVDLLAADSAHLYLWVTNPHILGFGHLEPSPREIAEAWGFKYKTLLTWVKTGPPGLGFYFRVNTEHVLFCTRGDARIPPEVRESNVIVAPRKGHSQKPEAFYDLVERVSPEPRVELFARRARFGWDYWGDESLQTASLGS
jgi:N6-adenosine-specific RNA methylase IME4